MKKNVFTALVVSCLFVTGVTHPINGVQIAMDQPKVVEESGVYSLVGDLSWGLGSEIHTVKRSIAWKDHIAEYGVPKVNKNGELHLSFLNLGNINFNDIQGLKNLTSLDLSYNRLMSLPPEIGQLKNLKKLDLQNNQLISLPPVVKKLKEKGVAIILSPGKDLDSLVANYEKNIKGNFLFGLKNNNIRASIAAVRLLARCEIKASDFRFDPKDKDFARLKMQINDGDTMLHIAVRNSKPVKVKGKKGKDAWSWPIVEEIIAVDQWAFLVKNDEGEMPKQMILGNYPQYYNERFSKVAIVEVVVE